MLLSAFKLVLILWILISAPITLFAVGWGIKALFMTAPVWASVVIYASGITVALSLVHLIDEARRNSAGRGG